MNHTDMCFHQVIGGQGSLERLETENYTSVVFLFVAMLSIKIHI